MTALLVNPLQTWPFCVGGGDDCDYDHERNQNTVTGYCEKNSFFRNWGISWPATMNFADMVTWHTSIFLPYMLVLLRSPTQNQSSLPCHLTHLPHHPNHWHNIASKARVYKWALAASQCHPEHGGGWVQISSTCRPDILHCLDWLY